MEIAAGELAELMAHSSILRAAENAGADLGCAEHREMLAEVLGDLDAGLRLTGVSVALLLATRPTGHLGEERTHRSGA